MSLDARQYLFYHDIEPEKIYRVNDSEGRTFILKLYRVERETDAVRTGLYFESKRIDNGDGWDPEGPESQTEWAFVENSVDSFLNHFQSVEPQQVSNNQEE